MGKVAPKTGYNNPFLPDREVINRRIGLILHLINLTGEK